METNLNFYLSAAAVVHHLLLNYKREKHICQLVHAELMFEAKSILGLRVMFNFYIPDSYSLKSWVGICTVEMFSFQV